MRNLLLQGSVIRIRRGGSWYNRVRYSSVSDRVRLYTSHRSRYLGFRLFRTQELK